MSLENALEQGREDVRVLLMNKVVEMEASGATTKEFVAYMTGAMFTVTTVMVEGASSDLGKNVDLVKTTVESAVTMGVLRHASR